MRISLRATDVLFDEIVPIRVEGAAPGAHVMIRATASTHGAQFASEGAFTADAAGTVDLTRDAPVQGSYAGCDPMGLFWSAKTQGALTNDGGLDPTAVCLTATNASGTSARAELRRHVVAEGVTREIVTDQGFQATLFVPAGSPRSGIVVVGGSEGGVPERHAAAIASRGYATLAVPYFGVDGLPPHLARVPIEPVLNALRFLRDRRDLSKGKVAILGASKGGELALLVAAHHPDSVDAVIGVVPSGVSFMGIGRGPRSARAFLAPSWTDGGRPVPFVPMRFSSKVIRATTFSRRPMRLADIYEAAMANTDAVARATFPLERFRGPVLLLSGQDDGMWPSSKLADIAMARLERRHGAGPQRHESFADCGHAISLPYEPAITSIPGAFAGRDLSLGGTPSGNARASVDTWRVAGEFLDEHLAP